MRVLIGCEESGTVRDAFIARGHDAFSCDLLPTRNVGPHFQQDIAELLRMTRGLWDLIILHPDCTAMCLSGNASYGAGMPKAHLRDLALAWTWALWDEAVAHCPRVAMENPMSSLSRRMKRTQEIHPWQFGHLEQKTTWLWLYGLPKLVATQDVRAAMLALPKNKRERLHYLPPSDTRSRERSTTFAGIAAAMAAQWSI